MGFPVLVKWHLILNQSLPILYSQHHMRLMITWQHQEPGHQLAWYSPFLSLMRNTLRLMIVLLNFVIFSDFGLSPDQCYSADIINFTHPCNNISMKFKKKNPCKTVFKMSALNHILTWKHFQISSLLWRETAWKSLMDSSDEGSVRPVDLPVP